MDGFARPEAAPAPTEAGYAVAQPPPTREQLRPAIDVTRLEVGEADHRPTGRLAAFLAADDPATQLREWFGSQAADWPKEDAAVALNSAITEIDRLLDGQLNAILHHEAFQKLEASWRGLDYLVRCADAEHTDRIQVRVLTATWREVERDLERAVEFDQSELFKKIYEAEFGTPGGSPYGLMIADYQIEPARGPATPTTTSTSFAACRASRRRRSAR